VVVEVVVEVEDVEIVDTNYIFYSILIRNCHSLIFVLISTPL